MGYYLADGIYPKWSTLVQSISKPQETKKQYYAMIPQACRKDVEQASGVLKSRFGIVQGPVRYWSKRVLHDIMTACIIMHNMIIEDERDDANIVNAIPPAIPNAQLFTDETERNCCSSDAVK